jgi:hypothetical protein
MSGTSAPPLEARLSVLAEGDFPFRAGFFRSTGGAAVLLRSRPIDHLFNKALEY